MNKKYILIILIILLAPCILSPASAANWTYNFSTSGYTYDLVNSTYMKDWLYYLIITNSSDVNWEFPVIGFAGSIMAPIVKAFTGVGVNSGNIVYLILFGLFIMMVWRQSGRVTIPAMIACIIGGGWAMLFPESAWPYAMLLLIAAIAAELTTFFAKE